MLLLGCSSGGGDDSVNATPSPPPPTSPPGSTPAPGGPAPVVPALFVLGDSLSDVGNAAGTADYLWGQTIAPVTVGLCNPADVLAVPRDCEDLFFRKSRVSDGEVAVEHLAKHLGVGELAPSLHVVPGRPSAGTDYAVASAEARGPNAEDLSYQVDRLLLDHRPLSADALYIVMIGGNDAIDAFKAATTSPQRSAAIVTSAVAAIVSNVERLLDFGARRIVVANVPDLSSLPAVRSRALAGPDSVALLARASAISDDFDRDVRTLLARAADNPRWSAPTAPVLAVFDLRAAFQAAQQEMVAAGGNARDACFDSDTYRQSPTAERHFHAECAPGPGGAPRFYRFVFWDDIHPTGAAHAAVGTALIAAIDAALAGS
jgi:phospholipase/lecithinase/hemolysin